VVSVLNAFLQMKHRKECGLMTKIYKIKNNFEQYTTLEFPSQQYISSYVAWCMQYKKMPLSEIRFEYTEHIIFMKLRPIGNY
jgi:hypothetical protein